MTAASSPAWWAMSSPVTETPALAIRGLRKSFGPDLAVRDVDLDVEPGAFLGLVWPNGAGKTTLLSMAVGLLRPDTRTGSHRCRDLGTMIVAIAISLLAMTGTMLPALMSALRHQSVPGCPGCSGCCRPAGGRRRAR